MSQRFVDESVEPDCIVDDAELHSLRLNAVARAHPVSVKFVDGMTKKFKDELDRTLHGTLARQAARSVLPNATESKIFWTANAPALRHFLGMRASHHAEVSIRPLSVQVLLLQKEAPHLFDDDEPTPLPDGILKARPSTAKSDQRTATG